MIPAADVDALHWDGIPFSDLDVRHWGSVDSLMEKKRQGSRLVVSDIRPAVDDSTYARRPA